MCDVSDDVGCTMKRLSEAGQPRFMSTVDEKKQNCIKMVWTESLDQ